MSEAYRPVQCTFHDVLEDAAVRHRQCVVRYREEDGSEHAVTTTIEDVFARDGAEYARLGNGALVRLDHLTLVEPMTGAPDASSPGGGSP